jgi:cytidylate kinase
MAVVTISSELGSGGDAIAERIAAALGYTLVDEHTFDRILRKYGLTKLNEVYESTPTILDLVRSENLLIVSMLNEIIEALGRRGNAVILSHVGFAVLGSFGDVLNVFVQAPLAQRLAAVMTSEGLTDRTVAEEHVRDDDTAHRMFVQRFYDRHWDDPSGYGLILDTGSLSVDEAAGKLVEAARSVAARAATGEAPTTAVLEVDPVLADAVESVLTEPVPG